MAAFGAVCEHIMCILFATVSASLAVYLHVVLAVILYNQVFHCSCEHIVLFLALCFVFDTTLCITIICFFFMLIVAQLQLSRS